MKVTHFALFSAVCLLVVLGRPDKIFNRTSPGPQRLDERQEEQFDETYSSDEIRVIYKVPTVDEENIADILWLKKAAALALDNGTAYFSVIDQEVSRRFVRQENTQLSVIDGHIRLEHDSMDAQYDAREIVDLVLTDYSL